MSSESGIFKMPSFDNVSFVDFSARKAKEIPQSKVPKPVGLTDPELETFLKVCNHLRNLGERNTASVSITDDELKIETKHYGDVEGTGSVVSGNLLCLSSAMFFGECPDVEDLKQLLEYVTLD